MDRIPRFYIKPNSWSGDKFRIDDDQVDHIHRSLRLNPGDKIILFDGQGEKFLCTLEEVHRKRVIAIKEEKLPLNISNIEVSLVQSIILPKKLDTIVKRLSEIGVSSIYPLESDFAQIKARDINKKYSRWEKLIIESCKQSERDIMLNFEEPIKFNALDKFKDYDLKLIASAKGEPEDLKNVLERHPNSKKIVYMIGPEGDFSPKELDEAKKLGFLQVKINNNILRTETAAIYMGSALIYNYGKFN